MSVLRATPVSLVPSPK